MGVEGGLSQAKALEVHKVRVLWGQGVGRAEDREVMVKAWVMGHPPTLSPGPLNLAWGPLSQLGGRDSYSGISNHRPQARGRPERCRSPIRACGLQHLMALSGPLCTALSNSHEDGMGVGGSIQALF